MTHSTSAVWDAIVLDTINHSKITELQHVLAPVKLWENDWRKLEFANLSAMMLEFGTTQETHTGSPRATQVCIREACMRMHENA